jgi:hypothetical protein
MDKSKQKMMKARIRRRKQTEADIEAIEPDKFTEATCGLPPASLGAPTMFHPAGPHFLRYAELQRDYSPYDDSLACFILWMPCSPQTCCPACRASQGLTSRVEDEREISV